MSTRRALFFSFLDRYAALVLSIASSMFIARLLTPAEIGVFSVTMVLLSFISALRDFGAGQYLVQEKELTRERIRGTWTVLLGTGVFFALVVLVAAKPVAAFYGDPRMVHIMWVISLNFAINPFGSLTYAWLMREMRFDALASMRFVSGVVGACTSVFLAWKGFGPISLALGSLFSTVANALMATHFRPAHFPWWPGRGELKRVASFGSKISATSLLSVAASGAPELMLGKLQSLATAALFSRANGLAAMFHRMFMDATQTVAAPMFARESRERGNINESFVLALAYVTALGWSFFLALALLAHPVIRILYGYQWDASIDATRIVALAYFIGLPAALCPSAITAVGGVNAVLRTAAITLVLHVIAIVAGAAISLSGVAVAFAISYLAGVALWLSVAQRTLGFAWRVLGPALLKSAAVASVTTLAPILAVFIYGWRPEERFAPLIVALLLAPCLFVAAVFFFRHPLRRELTKIWGWLQSILRQPNFLK